MAISVILFPTAPPLPTFATRWKTVALNAVVPMGTSSKATHVLRLARRLPPVAVTSAAAMAAACSTRTVDPIQTTLVTMLANEIDGIKDNENRLRGIKFLKAVVF